MTDLDVETSADVDRSTPDVGANSASGAKLAAGGTALALATMVASAGNYLMNLVLARWMTPAEFADANLMVTLMLVITAITVGLQLIAARFAGVYLVDGRADQVGALHRSLATKAFIVGLALTVVFVAGAPVWRDLFRSESALPFVILGLGWPFYLAQGVGRGILQGELGLYRLSFTFLTEMVVRVGLGLALVAAGFGVSGATMGLTVSFVATWLHVRYLVGRRQTGELSKQAASDIVTYAYPVAILLVAQIVINNTDVLVAKRFLDPDQAGVYAAVALVGRGVFFLSWAVASTLFPAVVHRSESGQSSGKLLATAQGVVLVIGVGISVGALVLGGPTLAMFAGESYASTSVPLAGYAFATTLFAMANLIATFHLSAGRTREARLLLIGGVIQTSLLLIGRSSIEDLITAQILAMGCLLAMVLMPASPGRIPESTNETKEPLT